ncbi:hypothetical protein AB0K62_13650 [Streptomyces halstedii]|uniref:hypothetical protein n=1 Tax=Streptomyces halstedii TaxID=1944 RepID=UPI00346008C5
MTTPPTTPDRPADQLRAAAELLREAAGHATPGPWRTHDTHLGNVGGHTATVLTDRPNLNDTELIAWLPTMSHEPWDEARNAWRNAGWMALLHPGVGLALAQLLDRHAKEYDASVAAAANVWPDSADEAARWLAAQVPPEALAVARQLLGTSTGEDTAAQCGSLSQPTYSGEIMRCVLPVGHPRQCQSTTEYPWVSWPSPTAQADLFVTETHRLALSEALGLGTGAPWDAIRDRAAELAAAPPAPADRATVRDRIRQAICEAEGFMWDTDMLEPDEYGEVADAVLAVLDAPADRAAGAKAATTIRRLRAERAELSRQLDCLRGDMREMETSLREQDAEFERIRRAPGEAAPTPLAAEWEKRGEYGDSSITDRARELRAVLAGEAAAGAHQTEQADTTLARVREWVTSDVVTAVSEFGNGYREAQRDIHDLIKPTITPAAPAAPEETR